MDWSDDLIEWLYGPDDYNSTDPPTVGEMYRRQEEEDRLRWIPGYREAVEEYIRLTKDWHASWIPGLAYPKEPPGLKELRSRISEWQRQRVDPYTQEARS